MNLQSQGLQTDGVTWVIAAALLALWVAAYLLLIKPTRQWQSAAMSLVGLAWLGVGVDLISRFFVLAYDSVNYGNMSTRLAERPPEVVNATLLVSFAYLLMFTIGGWAGLKLSPPLALAGLLDRGSVGIKHGLTLWVMLTLGCVLLSGIPGFPDSLFTPVALVSSLWVVPATLVWCSWFSGDASMRTMRFVVLAPGLIKVVISPYREGLILVALVPLFAALVAKRPIRLRTLAVTSIAGLLASTVIISAYRQVKWDGAKMSDVVSQISISQWEDHPYTSPWSELLRRFHALDSLMLTVDLVPSVFPYTHDNVFLDAVTRGIVPRIVYAGKQRSDAGFTFSATIWSFDDPTRAVAAIAPSMPGSLYEAGGFVFVGIGAFFWACLLGWIDRLKALIDPAGAAGIHTLFALQALAGTERDFPHAVSTIIQNIFVLAVVFLAMSTAVRRNSSREMPAPQPLATR